jgi:hypothetical protein
MPDPSPPRAPSIEPRVQLSAKQLVGFPIMLLIPILALFGVFGESEAHARAKSASLEMMVSYPSRMHYRQVQSLQVTVRNLAPTMADTVKVAFDTSYISRFTGVRFDPSAKTAYVVDLTDVKPSESRLISVELEGQVYGSQRSRVVARHGADSAMVHLRTLVFP